MLPKPVKRVKPKKRPSRKPKHSAKRARAEADRLWSQYIKRDGACIFVGAILNTTPCAHDSGCRCLDDWSRKPHTCKGELQAMHGIPKGPYPAARYELWNGVPGCAAAHSFYTPRPELWALWLQRRWGAEVYEARLRQANHPARSGAVEGALAALKLA
jgi:hypothetical protein